jgi:hypothetical protein
MERVPFLALVLALTSCYASANHGNDADVNTDNPGDPDADPVDMAEDIPSVPFTVDFTILNGSPLDCSSCVIYLDDTMGGGATYDLRMTYNGSGLEWHVPFCTVSCESVTDPAFCCIDCAAPLPAVRQLLPGQSVTVRWDGHQYPIDTDVCDCGCYRELVVGPGSGSAGICASSSYTCYGETCTVDAGGVIEMAEQAGEFTCADAAFSLPEDDGVTIVLIIQ